MNEHSNVPEYLIDVHYVRLNTHFNHKFHTKSKQATWQFAKHTARPYSQNVKSISHNGI